MKNLVRLKYFFFIMKTIQLFLGFLMLVFVNAAYHPSKMCYIEEYKNRKDYENRSKEVEDCSFLMFPFEEKSCTVFSRNVCDKKTSELQSSSVDYERQTEARFSVQVLPYASLLYLSSGDEIFKESELRYNESIKYPLSASSAINITFKILDDVKGLAISIKENSRKKSFCRLMDFKDLNPKGVIYPMELFYDCFYYMTERMIQNVTMTFTSLPMKRSLSYYVFIPPLLSHNSLCKWQPLIMVFKNALTVGLVQIKFSTAPHRFNVSSYLVVLVHASSMKTINKIAQPDVEEMISMEFSSVEEGFYYVSVKPVDSKSSSCSVSATQAFYVSAPYNIGRALMLVVSSVFLLLLFMVSVLKCCHMYYNKEIPYKQALLVYSQDCPVHDDFISSFGSYLTTVHKINVSTIYGKIEDPQKWIKKKSGDEYVFSRDPKDWIRSKYNESDIIIFIMSEGLCITFEEDVDIRVQEMSHWCHQLPNAKNYISFQIFNSPNALKKRFCIVRFPYSSTKQVPECLSDIGRCYQLPKQMKSFLCFLLDVKPLIPFTNLYPKLSGRDLDSVKKKKEFWGKMKIVQTALENECAVRTTKTLRFEQKHLQSLNENNYVAVDCEDRVTCREHDSAFCKDDRDIYLKDWEEYISSLYNESQAAKCENYFTPFIKEELEKK